jgi:NitT/TauT family transport system substrate-binding protein
MADDLTPVYYALQTGMYRRAGLDVRLTVSPTGAAVAEGVASGALDVGKSSLINLMNAHDRGVPIELVAPGAMYDAKAPFAELVVAADSPITTAKALNGKLIGVPYLNDFNEMVTKLWVGQNGGDPATLQFVEVPNTAEAAALQQHRVAAVVLQEPELAQALDERMVRVLGPAYSAIAPSFMFAAWFAQHNWVDAHRAEVDTFARITADAATYTNAHPEATAAMMSEATKIPLDILRKMHRVTSATTLQPSMVQPLIDAAVKAGAIPRTFAAADFIYTSGARAS